MLDWYSTYVMIRARQAELVGAAELRRRLAEAGAVPRSRPDGGQCRQSLRYRVGAALVMMGRSMQAAGGAR